ncbi:MAG: PQQ-binding-like beta-propeller repeat protein [Pirellulaceae bacterium]|nr:PQQ-binding-like beta-propeller repeat protein [Planctomycetales bacterium]
MLRTLALGCLCAAGFLAPLSAADWPQFRGPTGDGVSTATKVPIEWDADTNVAWKAPLPRPANGSPIVSGGRVFVTSAEDADGKQRSLICFDAADGKQLWKQTVQIDKKMPTHQTNPYCGTTPAADGERVVVWHASAGLHCYDFAGNSLWSRQLGEFEHMWGYGTSPILHNGRIYLSSGPGKQIWVAAFDLKTGDTIWQTDEPINGNGERNADGKYMGSWSTPIITKIGGQEQLIAIMPTRVNGYDLQSGKILWSASGVSHDRGDLSYSSPVIVDDLCVVTSGFQGVTLAFKLGGAGDLTGTTLYRNEKSPQNIGSGVTVGGYVYRVNAGPGTIECLDPATGEIKWTDRAAGANMWGSLVLAEGRLYVTNQDGATVVFAPNPAKFDQLAVNKLGESTNSTPAMTDSHIYLRTAGHLWCIGK